MGGGLLAEGLSIEVLREVSMASKSTRAGKGLYMREVGLDDCGCHCCADGDGVEDHCLGD